MKIVAPRSRSKSALWLTVGALTLGVAASGWGPGAQAEAAATAPGRAVEGIGVRVEGTGMAEVRPDRIEVRASLSVEEEVAEESEAAFREARRRILEALESAAIPNLVVRGEGARFSYRSRPEEQMGNVFIMGGTPDEPDPGVQVKEAFVLTIGSADKLDPDAQRATIAKVLDVALDAGMTLSGASGSSNMMVFQSIGPASVDKAAGLVTFTLSPELRRSIERDASELAIRDAERRAGELAEIAGRALGRAQSIHVTSLQGNWESSTADTRCKAVIAVEFGLL